MPGDGEVGDSVSEAMEKGNAFGVNDVEGGIGVLFFEEGEGFVAAPGTGEGVEMQCVDGGGRVV